ncbi:SdpI family protein [Clostridium felsineum]|uniref:SdpI family protein n=1 Tax=Clostridium felsineum TaxID=36839 RepID=UPI00214D1F8E|nr:SdpI family protein [Clostridium felsineum]MCR3758709.1 SdpI family protein [Clostridium felsineum]
MFIWNFIVPIIILLFGLIFRNHSPKNINGIYGYRTSMATKNKETWDFAHKCLSKLWIKIGTVMLIITAIYSYIVMVSTFNYKFKENMDVVLILIQTFVLIMSIIPVEKELKKNFDENGNRKNSK